MDERHESPSGEQRTGCIGVEVGPILSTGDFGRGQSASTAENVDRRTDRPLQLINVQINQPISNHGTTGTATTMASNTSKSQCPFVEAWIDPTPGCDSDSERLRSRSGIT